MTGSQCCFRSSRVIAKSANKVCTAIRRCSVGVGPDARSATNSYIIVVSQAGDSHSSKHGHACARPAALRKPTLRHPLPISPILPSPSARDFRPPVRSSSGSSRLAPPVCACYPLRPRPGDPWHQRILHGQLSSQRPIQLAQDQSNTGTHAYPSRALL